MTRTSSTIALSSILAVGLGAAVLACDAYDPRLGFEPFRCGDVEPRCPLGYTCAVFTGGEAICRQTGVDAPDAGPPDGALALDCYDDDPVEPNDGLDEAFDTGIPERGTRFALVGLAICPASDEDLFALEVVAPDTGVAVDVAYRPSLGLLVVEVLNASGVAIATAAPLDDAPNTLHAEVANLPLGMIYIRIHSADGIESNYDSIEVVTTGP